MENSHIEWTSHTYNPWTGCTKVSLGCKNCYAENLCDTRRGRNTWGLGGTRTRVESTLKDPYEWNEEAKASGVRTRVFCASLADVFDDHLSIQQEWRDELWRTVRQTPFLDYLVLTKRPENFSKFLPADWGEGYPNVCLIVSTERQEEADLRIPKLLATPAKYRGLSVEPLLGEIDLSAYIEELDWIIVGGESTQGKGKARPMEPEWARKIRDLCQQHGKPFFFKQWGSWTLERQPGGVETHNCASGEILYYRHQKKKNGHLLDGKVHQDHPFGKPISPTDLAAANSLTDPERERWTHNLAIVREGADAFFRVGAALKVIRDDRLYRADHPSFEDFCRDELGLSKTHANRQIIASVVHEDLGKMASKDAESGGFGILPRNEAQARPLAKLKRVEQRRRAWGEVLQRAKEGATLSAELVNEVVLEIDPTLRRESKKGEADDGAEPTPGTEIDPEPASPAFIDGLIDQLRLARQDESWTKVDDIIAELEEARKAPTLAAAKKTAPKRSRENTMRKTPPVEDPVEIPEAA
ncbi:MAG: phage Gp37/Gp68 family protein [Verrucomicrobiae bacterium]|nr:phage Gp37/Gp68 family protein [Verrucomicrobiae bacterium]